MIKSCCVICGKQECPGHTYSVPGRAVTDNTAVIRALEKRVEELEAVAEAAVVVHEQGPLGNFSEWEVLGDALRASGYLNE